MGIHYLGIEKDWRYVPNVKKYLFVLPKNSVKVRAGEWNVEKISFTLWSVSQRGMNELSAALSVKILN